MATKKEGTRKEVFTCLHCGNKTSHDLLHTHTQKVPLGIYDASFGEIDAENYIFLFECSTCEGITIKSLFSEEIDPESKIDMELVKTLYPVQKEFPKNVPKGMLQIYSEAAKIKRISSLAFCILIRKALEALCEDQKAEGKNLNEKIKYLAKKNSLPEVFIDMIDSIRILGNKGAHDIDVKFTKEQTDTLDYFFNVVLEYLYIAPQKVNLLKKSLK